MRHPRILILAFYLCAQCAFGQLYLMTGSPNPKGTETFPSALLQVTEKGQITRIAEIVAPEFGTEWIGVSYDWRKAVLLSSYKENAVSVVDFDKAAVVKKCKMPEAAGSFIYAWLANPPAPGPSLEWLETGQDPVKDAVVQGMVLDPALPCKESFAKLEMEAIRYAIAHGIAGIADIVPKDGLRTSTARDDSGTVTAFTDKHVPLGFNVPQSLRKGSQLRVMSDMLVNDAHAFVLGMGDGKGDFRLLLFRKSDRTWRRVNSGGELYDSIRGFGRYLALVELRSKSAQNPRSAGMDAWKPGSNGLRPDLRSRIAENRDSFIYSGRLHLYDIETEKFYSISTNQGDSEVLLVESNVVYYRAAGQLFSAPITDRGIGRSQLLAEDDAILDAHWAFIKH